MATWRKLATKRLGASGISLYVKAELTDSGYTVYLTDLIYIWVEQLDRRGVMRRAMDENTTIDPTNGPDQLKYLLERISGCLYGTANGVTIVSSKSTRESVNLVLVSQLPAPLEPLRWPMALKLEDPARFSTELLQPALQTVGACCDGFKELLNVIQEKDTVIHKLQDKLETAGLDLGSAFPGAGKGNASKYRSGVTAFPGLKEFDYPAWQSSVLQGDSDPLQESVLPRLSKQEFQTVSIHNDLWWDNLPPSDTEEDGLVPDSQAGAESESQFSVPERARNRKASLSSTSTEESTMFETQADKDTADRVLDSNIVNESLQSPEDPIPSMLASDQREDTAKVPPKRLGRIGGKQADSAASAELLEPPIPNPQATPRKSRLGRIGGTSKMTDPKGASNSNENELSEVALPSTEMRGGTSATPRDADISLDQEARRERETSQEKADRRRAELKHHLEEKKKAPNMKKKQRKF